MTKALVNSSSRAFGRDVSRIDEKIKIVILNTMDKFTTIKSTVVPLSIEDIDTDQIIPARFLKATTREGFGDNLFRDWRYDDKNNPKKDFILNNPEYKGQILVAGKNFGCGSSREHAAWAIHDFGFKVVISTTTSGRARSRNSSIESTRGPNCGSIAKPR